MNGNGANWLRGYVQIMVSGPRIEQLINRLNTNKMTFWQLHFRNDEHEDVLQMYIILRDFFRLRPLLKGTGCRVRVKRRIGLPFMLKRLERRKWFLAGCLGFIVALFLLSSLVWQVHIMGNETISRQEVLQAAKKHGIYPYQWKFKLQEPSQLADRLIQELPGASWIGVEIRGTHVYIEVVESSQPEQEELLSPRHLISTSDAVITRMNISKGRPVVKVNQRVKKGDLLVSGILGDEQSQRIVIADGEVSGYVWHHYQMEVPLMTSYRSYTGQHKNRGYLVIGRRALQLLGYGKPDYERFEIETEQKVLQWRKFKLPIGWLQERVMEFELKERKISVAEAKEFALQRAREDILQQKGDKSSIHEENVLQVKTESGKVYMDVLFEVEQIISKEQPIVQGE